MIDNLDDAVAKAERMLDRIVDPELITQDKAIPTALLKNCKAIAFVTLYKAGLFVFGANVGGGCIVSKVPDPSNPVGYRWSGPSALVAGGAGGGFIFGAERVDSVIILNTREAVEAFMSEGNVTFGGSLSIAAGPVGRAADVAVGVSEKGKMVAAYSYSKSKGLMVSATLEGAFCVSKQSYNTEYYRTDMATPEDVLLGRVEIPEKALPFIQKIEKVTQTDRVNCDTVLGDDLDSTPITASSYQHAQAPSAVKVPPPPPKV